MTIMKWKLILGSFLASSGLTAVRGLQGPVVPTTSTSTSITSIRLPIALDTQNFGLRTPSPFVPQQKQKTSSTSLTTELWGEAFGTFWIVGVGSMATMSATFVDPFSTTPLHEIALVWSAAVAMAIYLCTTQKWGEAHFNPAMTIVSAVFRDFSWNKVVPYTMAQLTGSTVGSAVAYTMHSSCIRDYEEHQEIVRSSSVETARVFGEYFDSLTVGQAFGVEALGTAILAATAFASTSTMASQHQSTATAKLSVPLIMGGTVFGLINWLAPYTQCGMNPVRDFGPRLVAYAAGWTDVAFTDCWVYILAPIVGALVGAGLVEGILDEQQETQETRASL